MIEKLEKIKEYGWDGANGGVISERAPNNEEMMEKINEIIEKVNEIEELLND